MTLNIEALYQRYGPMVHRRCRALLGDAEADDAMQDVFVALLERRGRIEDRGLSSLLYTMATHLSLNRLRARKPAPGGDPDDALSRIAAAGDLESELTARNLLAKVFQREPASTRTIAVLHFVDGMTHAEVAREVGMSVSGVRKRLRQLQARLGDLAGDR